MDKYSYTISKGADNAVTVTVEVGKELFAHFMEHAYEHMASGVKLKGFRAGKAPRAKVEAALGPDLVDHAIKDLLPHVAAEIVDKESLNPVTQLDYELLAPEKDTALKYAFTFTDYPQVKLGKLNNLKVKREEIQVTDEDIEKVIARLIPTEGNQEVTAEQIVALNMPGVDTLEKLQEQIRARVTEMKREDTNQKYTTDVIDAAVTASTIPLPEKLIDQQAKALVDDYINQISRLKVDIDPFLEAQGMDRTKLDEQKKAEAKKKLERELMLNQIVKEYSLTPTMEDIEKELSSITDPEMRKEYDTMQGRRYIVSVLVQQRGVNKLLELVEGKKPA